MEFKGVVISGLPCSGKSVVCNRLCELYQLRFLSIGEMWRAEWRRQHPNEDISFEEFWRSTSEEDNRQVNVDAKEIMGKEWLVVDSRYTAFYCKDLPYLRVFMTAPLEIRAQRAEKREREKVASGLISRARRANELMEILRQREEDEYEAGMNLFGQNYKDMQHYHLAIDTGSQTIEQEVEMLQRHIGEPGA